MSTYRLSTAQIPRMEFEISRLTTKQPITWLRQGWQDVRAAPFISVTYGLLVALVALLCASLFTAMDRFYLVPFFFGGFLIIAPFLSVGLMAIAMRREQHDAPSVPRILARNRPSIAMMGIFLLLVFLNWIMLSNLLFGGDLP